MRNKNKFRYFYERNHDDSDELRHVFVKDFKSVHPRNFPQRARLVRDGGRGQVGDQRPAGGREERAQLRGHLPRLRAAEILHIKQMFRHQIYMHQRQAYYLKHKFRCDLIQLIE